MRFWELAPSPNSTKIRMALRFKGIDFEAIPVDPADRSALRKASGQDLSPVIEDRGIILPDSEAILQYLDANYPESPRLFPADKTGRKRCDAWKTRLDSEVARHWLPIFLHAIGRADSYPDTSPGLFRDALAVLEAELGDGSTFDAEAPIQDLRAAEWGTYALPSESVVASIPVFGRTREMLAVESGSLPRLERFVAPWNARLA